MVEKKNMHFETLQLHAGQESPDSATGARTVPVYLSSSFVFGDSKEAAARFALNEPGYLYSRLSNPTQTVLEKRIAALEGGVDALAVASGAAAIFYAITNISRSGDHVVAARTLYGGSYNLLANTLVQYGIETAFVNPDDPENFEAAIRENTKLIFIESMGNPNCNIIDIGKVATIAHRHSIPLIVDNTFATPFLLRPISLGADIVVHSATKFIGGHGTALGGIIVDGGKFGWKGNDKFPQINKPDAGYHGAVFADIAGDAAYVTRIRATLLRDTGAAISPVNAFVLLQGCETLSLRVERHVYNTLKVVEYLSVHPKVARVNHPSMPYRSDNGIYKRYFPNGGGSIFTFDIKGGAEEAMKFIDGLELFSLLANVADMKSLAIHPASTTHSQLSEEELMEQGILPSTIRLSIGTEHIDDIIADIEQALAGI